MTTNDQPTYFQNKSNPLTKLSGTNQSCKSSYTIPKEPLDERYGEHVKIEIMFLIQNKIYLWMKIINKKGGDQP
jgi:hypothetical protein